MTPNMTLQLRFDLSEGILSLPGIAKKHNLSLAEVEFLWQEYNNRFIETDTIWMISDRD